LGIDSESIIIPIPKSEKLGESPKQIIHKEKTPKITKSVEIGTENEE
jgi:hypothetical protein